MTHPFAAIGLLTFGALLCGVCTSTGCGSGNSPPAAAAGNGAPNPAATGAAAPAATFSQINTTILQPSCIQCHASASGSGGVNLSSYSGVIAEVSSGDPSSSALYNAVANGIMPPSGPLPQAQIQAIQSWIAAGAQNN